MTKRSHTHLCDSIPLHSLPFYGQMMARARYCQILRFLHFMDNNRNGDDRTDDRLWKIRDLFEIIRTNFSKFYNPSEHLAVDEVIVKFKGRVLFIQYIPKKRKRFGITMFKLCNSTSVIYKCVKCDVGLCVDRKCFQDYHTKPNL